MHSHFSSLDLAKVLPVTILKLPLKYFASDGKCTISRFHFSDDVEKRFSNQRIASRDNLLFILHKWVRSCDETRKSRHDRWQYCRIMLSRRLPTSSTCKWPASSVMPIRVTVSISCVMHLTFINIIFYFISLILQYSNNPSCWT